MVCQYPSWLLKPLVWMREFFSERHGGSGLSLEEHQHFELGQGEDPARTWMAQGVRVISQGEVQYRTASSYLREESFKKEGERKTFNVSERECRAQNTRNGTPFL